MSPIYFLNCIGRIEGLERVEPNSTLFSGSSRSTSRSSDKILFSFAIAIRNVNGDIVTASTEDRTMGGSCVGQCVQAKVFPRTLDLEKPEHFLVLV
ncbi:MAG: hypothetical protein H6625_00660 [Bdellovibrionaceae bacterium]|nr:hypothetical protein [Pseudobdellovibrionaceae bacterium]